MLYFANVFYLAIQRSVWRDIKFAFVFVCLFVCTVEDISTQDGAIGVKFLAQGRTNTRDGNEIVRG